jgi:hypothetical protein
MAAWILSGAILTGGSGAVIVKALRAKKATNVEQRRNNDGDSNDRQTELESGNSGGLGDSTQGSAGEGEGIHKAA